MKKHIELNIIFKLLTYSLYFLFISGTFGFNLSGQVPLYEFNAELSTQNNSLNVKLNVKLPSNGYESDGTIGILFKDNFMRDRNSDYQKVWLKSFGPELYFYTDRENSGFHNVKVFVNGHAASTSYYDISEGLMVVKLHDSLKNDSNILLTIEYKVYPPFVKDIYSIYDWYPVILKNQELDNWKKSKFTPFSFINTTLFNYNLTLKVPDYLEVIINNKNVKKIKDGDFIIIQSTGETDKLSILALKENKRILKGVIRFYGEQIPYTYVMLDDREIYSSKMEEDLQRIFGYYKTYVGAFPYEQIVFVESGNNALHSYTGKFITEIGHPKSEDFFKQLVKQTGRVWIDDLVKQEDFTEDWYFEGILEYLAERYFRIENATESVEPEVKFNAAYDYEPTGKWLEQYQINYLRKNIPLQSETTACISQQYKKFSIALFLAYMEMVAGESKFSNAMKSFYKDFGGKTIDFMTLIQYLSNELNTDFTSSALLMQREALRVDYSIKSVRFVGEKVEITINNSGIHPLEFPLLVADDNGQESVHRIEGFTGNKTISLTTDIPAENLKIISIDPYGMLADQNRENNHYFLKNKNATNAPVSLRFGSDNNSFTRDLYLSPAPLFNENDKFMLGVLLANNLNNIRHFKWYVMPAYSFSTKKWVGQARTSYDLFFEDSGIERLQLMTSLKSYDFNRNNSLGYSQRYVKADPSVAIVFKNPDPGCSNITQLRYRFVYINEQYPAFTDGKFEKLTPENIAVHRLEFEKKGGGVLAPFTLTSNLEYHGYKGGFTGENQRYLKLTAAIDQRFRYDVSKFMYVRVFGSAFVLNTQRNINSYANNLVRGTIALIHQGFNDYLYDEYFASRQNQGVRPASQVSLENGGGFKTPVGSAFSIGMSNNMAFSINLSSDLPFKLPFNLPLRPYFDAGIYSVPSNVGMQMKTMWNGGLLINVEDLISIHLPLVYSEELKNTVISEKGSFFRRMSFMINMGKLAPIN